MNKQQMFEYFRSRKCKDYAYFYIACEIEGQKTRETILNEFGSLEDKIAYIDSTYNDELEHVSGKVKIVEYGIYTKFGPFIGEGV